MSKKTRTEWFIGDIFLVHLHKTIESVAKYPCVWFKQHFWYNLALCSFCIHFMVRAIEMGNMFHFWATLAVQKKNHRHLNASAPNFNDAKCESNKFIRCTFPMGCLFVAAPFIVFTTKCMKQKCCVPLIAFKALKIVTLLEILRNEECNRNVLVAQCYKVKKRERENEKTKKLQKILRAPEYQEPECVTRF